MYYDTDTLLFYLEIDEKVKAKLYDIRDDLKETQRRSSEDRYNRLEEIYDAAKFDRYKAYLEELFQKTRFLAVKMLLEDLKYVRKLAKWNYELRPIRAYFKSLGIESMAKTF